MLHSLGATIVDTDTGHLFSYTIEFTALPGLSKKPHVFKGRAHLPHGRIF